jgi:hypothetical protein
METNMADRLIWRKPQLVRLPISWTTGDFLKDGSTEDIITKSNTWPAGLPPPGA